MTCDLELTVCPPRNTWCNKISLAQRSKGEFCSKVITNIIGNFVLMLNKKISLFPPPTCHLRTMSALLPHTLFPVSFPLPYLMCFLCSPFCIHLSAQCVVTLDYKMMERDSAL